MNLGGISAFVLALLPLMGCSQGNGILSDTREIPTGYNVVESRVFVLPTCPITGKPGNREAGFLAPLASAGIATLVDTGITLTGNLLQAMASDSTTPVSAQTGTYQYSWVPAAPGGSAVAPIFTQKRCIVFIRGQFDPTVPTKSENFDSWWNSHTAERKVASPDLFGDPDIYLEAYMVPSTDRGSFTIIMRDFEYRKRLAGNWFTSDRDLVLTFVFEKPGASSGYALGTLTFPSISPPFRLSFVDQHEITTGWLPVATMSDPASKLVQTFGTAPPAAPVDLEPVNVTVQIAETAKAGQFIKALSAAFQDHKSDLSTAAVSAIDPVARTATKDKQQTAMVSARGAAADAYSAYAAALDTFNNLGAGASASAKAQAWTSLSKAYFQYNETLRLLGEVDAGSLAQFKVPPALPAPPV